MHFFWSLFTSWGERLRSPELQGKIRGPIYFMWGTDHEDQVCFIAFSILFSLAPSIKCTLNTYISTTAQKLQAAWTLS